MIEYDNSWYGLKIAFRLFGSAIPHALPFGLFSAIVSIMLSLFGAFYDNTTNFENPHGHAIFSGIVTFLIVFRSNMAYLRFMDGCTRLFQMYNSWSDAAMTFVVGDERSPDERNFKEYRLQMIHNFSLMMAMSFQNLSGKMHRKGLKRAQIIRVKKKVKTHTGEVREIFRHSAVVSPESSNAHKGIHIPNFIIDGSGEDVARSSSPSIKPESSMFQGSISELNMEYLNTPRATGFMSNAPSEEVIYTFPVIGGVSEVEHGLLSHNFNGVEYNDDPTFRVYVWITRLLFERLKQGGIYIPPPVTGRCMNQLTDGLAAYSQCLKLVEIPFPFPYAQLVLVLLLVFMFTTPIMVTAYIKSTTMAALLVFFTVAGCFSLNEVAGQIEQPFGYDINDLPLPYILHTFNQRLAALLDSDPYHDTIRADTEDKELPPLRKVPPTFQRNTNAQNRTISPRSRNVAPPNTVSDSSVALDFD